MKKLLMITMVILMGFNLFGCTPKDNNTNNEPNNNNNVVNNNGVVIEEDDNDEPYVLIEVRDVKDFMVILRLRIMAITYF